MKGKLKHKIVNDFSKGYNTNIAPHLLKAGSSPYMLNCSIAQTGSISKLKGSTQVGTTQSDFSAGIRNMGLYNGVNGEKVVCNGGQKVKYWNGTDWTDIAGLTAIIEANKDKRFGYLMWQGKLLFMSQFLYMAWDGSGSATDESSHLSTLGDILMLDGQTDQLWVTGDEDNPSTVFVSDTENYASFSTVSPSTGAVIKVYDKDGSKNVGMAMIFENRYVMKTNKIVRVDLDVSVDPAVYRKKITDSKYGPIGKDAWTIGENNVYFFTGSEIRAFGYFQNYQSERSENAGLSIKPTIIGDMNTEYLEDAKITFHNNKLIMTYVSIDQTTKVFDKQLVWDLDLPTQNPIEPISIGLWDFNIEASVSVGRDLYFGSTDSGVISVFDDTYNREGVAIETIYETIADPLNTDAQQYKSMRYIEYEFSNILGSVEVTLEGQTNSGVLIDSATFNIGSKPMTGLWDECLWNAAIYNCDASDLQVPDYIRDRQSITPIVAQTFKLIFKNDTIDESFTLSSIGYMYEEKDKRRYNPSFVI